MERQGSGTSGAGPLQLRVRPVHACMRAAPTAATGGAPPAPMQGWSAACTGSAPALRAPCSTCEPGRIGASGRFCAHPSRKPRVLSRQCGASPTSAAPAAPSRRPISPPQLLCMCESRAKIAARAVAPLLHCPTALPPRATALTSSPRPTLWPQEAGVPAAAQATPPRTPAAARGACRAHRLRQQVAGPKCASRRHWMPGWLPPALVQHSTCCAGCPNWGLLLFAACRPHRTQDPACLCLQRTIHSTSPKALVPPPSRPIPASSPPSAPNPARHACPSGERAWGARDLGPAQRTCAKGRGIAPSPLGPLPANFWALPSSPPGRPAGCTACGGRPGSRPGMPPLGAARQPARRRRSPANPPAAFCRLAALLLAGPQRLCRQHQRAQGGRRREPCRRRVPGG